MGTVADAWDSMCDVGAFEVQRRASFAEALQQ